MTNAQLTTPGPNIQVRFHSIGQHTIVVICGETIIRILT